MDTQPPPATAFLDAMLCSDVRGTAARARLEVIEHPLTMTFGMSKAAMAPPQVEHGWTVEFGQPLACPTAELPTKLLSCTRRNTGSAAAEETALRNSNAAADSTHSTTIEFRVGALEEGNTRDGHGRIDNAEGGPFVLWAVAAIEDGSRRYTGYQ
jgi:hypothetical protein